MPEHIIHSQQNKPSSKSLPFSAVAALGCGQIAKFFLDRGIVIMAVPFYQMTLGVDPFLLSLAMSVPVLFGMLLTPWVGYKLDLIKRKGGSRKAIIFLPTIFCSLVYGLLWMVPQDWSEYHQFIFLFVCSLAFQLSSNFIDVPLSCLKFEATTDPQERTKLFATLSFMGKTCGITHQWLFPLSQLAIFGSAINGVQTVGWFIGLVLIGFMAFIPAIYAIEAKHQPEHELENANGSLPIDSHPKVSLLASIKVTLKNRTFLYIIMLSLCIGGGVSYAATMDFYLIVYYMCNGDVTEGAIWKGMLSTFFAFVGLVYLPIVVKLIKVFGNYRVLFGILSISALGGVVKWFIYVPEVRWLLLLDAMLSNMIWIGLGVIVMAMLAQCCDIEEEKTKQDQKGLYLSVYNVILHFVKNFAFIISGLTLNLIGFDANLGGEQSENALFAMRIMLAGGTTFFCLLALFILCRMKKANLACLH